MTKTIVDPSTSRKTGSEERSVPSERTGSEPVRSRQTQSSAMSDREAASAGQSGELAATAETKAVPAASASPASAASAAPALTAADFILRQLHAWDVRRIYGVLGDANLAFLDALAKDGRIDYIGCAHEGAAALMASAESKLTGRIGVCLATSGPGIANLLNGLGDADADGARVLALTGQLASDKIGTHAKQDIDQQRLAAPLAGETHLAVSAAAVPQLLLQSLIRLCTEGGTAHLAVPKNMWAESVPTDAAVRPYMPHLHQPVHAPEAVLMKAAELLSGAHRPALLIGRGASAVAAALPALAERLTAAVVTTMPARPLFPNDHELYAGGLGQAGSEASSRLLAEADVVAIFGATWWPDDYAPSASGPRIVQIDVAPRNIGVKHPVELGVVAALEQAVPALAERLRLTPQPDRIGWSGRIRQLAGAWKTAIETEASRTGTPIPPQRLMRALAEQAAADAIIAVDTGDHTLWFNRIFQARPQQRFLLSGRWRTLGFALPAAIAAQLAHPGREVWALAGDGGAVQTIMEFSTAVRHNLPLILIVVNNGAYAMERNRMSASGLTPLGGRAGNPDFARLAAACGGEGYKADHIEALERALTEARRNKKPAVIEVLVDDTVVPHTRM